MPKSLLCSPDPFFSVGISLNDIIHIFVLPKSRDEWQTKMTYIKWGSVMVASVDLLEEKN